MGNQLTGNYNNGELSFVESPCFDFSSLTVDPVFRFAFVQILGKLRRYFHGSVV